MIKQAKLYLIRDLDFTEEEADTFLLEVIKNQEEEKSKDETKCNKCS